MKNWKPAVKYYRSGVLFFRFPCAPSFGNYVWLHSPLGSNVKLLNAGNDLRRKGLFTCLQRNMYNIYVQ